MSYIRITGRKTLPKQTIPLKLRCECRELRYFLKTNPRSLHILPPGVGIFHDIPHIVQYNVLAYCGVCIAMETYTHGRFVDSCLSHHRYVDSIIGMWTAMVIVWGSHITHIWSHYQSRNVKLAHHQIYHRHMMIIIITLCQVGSQYSCHQCQPWLPSQPHVSTPHLTLWWLYKILLGRG